MVDRFRASLANREVDLEKLRTAVPGEYNRAARDNFARLVEASAVVA